MTIDLSLTQTSDLDVLCRAVYRVLCAEGEPNLAREAVVVREHARDADEYVKAVLALSDELRFSWLEARP